MIIFEYCKEGTTINDFEVDDNIKTFQEYLKHQDKDDRDVFKFSTALLFQRIRLAVKRGELDHNKIRFKFKDDIIFINSRGNLDTWLPGFLDIEDDYLLELIDWKEN